MKTPTGILLILIAAFLLIEASFRKQRENDDEELEAIKEEIRRLKVEKESKQLENEKESSCNAGLKEKNNQSEEADSQKQREKGGR